jgi:signal transduction histidine kinase
MDSLAKVTLFKLIEPRIWWTSAIGLLVFTSALGYWVVDVQAFEAFYDYSRAHESWQMDHVVMVGLVLLTAIGVLTGAFARLFAKRLIAVTKAQLLAERRLQQMQQQAALGTLLGGMAHHINNHLQPVILLTKMVQENLPENSEDQKDLAIALDAAQKASEVLLRIKKIARVDADATGSCPVAASLKDSMSLAAMGRPANIQIVSFFADISGQVSMSKAELETVLTHLLRNAMDSMGSRAGKISVQLTEMPPRPPAGPIDDGSRLCRLQVADDGEGMSEEQVARIFEPFFTTRPQGQGMGLGMAEAHALVDKAGGYFEVHSALGQGTQMTVYLPLR